MEIEVAPTISQVRLDIPPAEILLGVAVKDLITGAVPSVSAVTVTVAVVFSVP
jgi:hypothetical protein